MGLSAADGPALADAVAARASLLHDALDALDDEALLQPSQLEGWTRLTVVCHLRYGAHALARMTDAALAGQPTSYYPGGRSAVRPTTLVPDVGETARAVVVSLASADAALAARWRALDGEEWERPLHEPADQPDLGPTTLLRLALLRLTELEVHGSDLELAGPLQHWSDTFVRLALPFRLDWLNERRSNHRDADTTLAGSWLLRAVDGPSYLVTVDGDAVTSVPCSSTSAAHAALTGTSRNLLALLLGRLGTEGVELSGDRAFAAAFTRAFPGP